jgi:Zn-dependent metalloprotease
VLQHLPKTAGFSTAAQQTGESARILVKAGIVAKGATQIVRSAWRAVGVA